MTREIFKPNIDRYEATEEKVSDYLKERKLIKYVKSKVGCIKEFQSYEATILCSKKISMDVFYDRLVADSSISISKLLKPVLIKKKIDLL